MVKFSTYFTLWMGTLALAFAYQKADLEIYLYAPLLIGSLWTWGLLRFKERMPRFGMILLTLLAIIGVFKELPFGWMLAGALNALLSYDLSNFYQRLRFASETEDKKTLQRVHLTRLSIITFLGLALSTSAMLWKAKFSFEWAIFLMLVGVWGISLLVGWVRKS